MAVFSVVARSGRCAEGEPFVGSGSSLQEIALHAKMLASGMLFERGEFARGRDEARIVNYPLARHAGCKRKGEEYVENRCTT